MHDIRRSAVRDMTRAGVQQAVAQSLSGHRTSSLFARYNITAAEDQREALRKTAEYRQAKLTPMVVTLPQVLTLPAVVTPLGKHGQKTDNHGQLALEQVRGKIGNA
ncbi:MAG TPA: hypothetical protein VEG30_12795 [Terriglobales bacterium]|nr:hypothetical protein [Terriglobales bacterium]